MTMSSNSPEIGRLLSLTARWKGRDPAAEAAALDAAFASGDEPVWDEPDAGEDQDDEAGPARTLLANAYTAAELQHMQFAPLRQFVPGLIAEGFGALVGGPKLGKSWMVLNLALGLAYGGTVLGKIKVEQCKVLYLALEDGKRRIQDRTEQLLKDQDAAWPANLTFVNVVEPGKVIETIREWYAKHPGSLVILDTLSKNRPASRSGSNQYLDDYAFGSRLKAVVDQFPGSGLLAVHHDRKAKSDDFVDNSSGTNGLTGSMDYMLFLTRKRKSGDGTISVTGRDVDEAEYAVRTEDGSWTLVGDDLQAAAAEAEAADEARKNRLGERSLAALAFVAGRPRTTPADLAGHLGVSDKIAGNLLGKLFDDGYIARPARGTYSPLTSSESGESGESPDQEPLFFSPPEKEAW